MGARVRTADEPRRTLGADTLECARTFDADNQELKNGHRRFIQTTCEERAFAKPASMVAAPHSGASMQARERARSVRAM